VRRKIKKQLEINALYDIIVVEWKPNNNLPDQGKNQYWTVYIDGKQKLCIHKGSFKEWSDLLKEGKHKLAKIPSNGWEWKPITTACLKWST